MIADLRLRLRNGRHLAYCESGTPDGVPVFHFHGSPGSRLEQWGGEQPYVAAGVRLITTDRPGIGGSDANSGRAVIDWADDVAELADALDLRRIAVMGHSLGGAYALACACALPEVVAAAAIVSSVPRLDERGRIDAMGTARYWRMARDRPGLMRMNYATLGRALRWAPPFGHWLFFHRASKPDRIAVAAPEVRRRFRAAVLEAGRPSAAGLVDDMRVALRPWGFTADRIESPVTIWHGRQDHHVPPSAAEKYAELIPRSESVFVAGAGHFSLIEAEAERIVRRLVEQVTDAGHPGAA